MNWLLLRGLAREQRHWGRFPALFEATVTGAKTFLLDFPGAGTEHSRRGPASVAAIVDDLRSRWLPLQARSPGPWGILGVSLGGMVTMQWAADHPADFARVVLANTSAGNLNKPWERMQLGVLPTVVRGLVTKDRVDRERRILKVTTRLVPEPGPIATAWAKFHDDHPLGRVNALRQIYAGSRFKAPRSLAMPVLVLSGAKDQLMSPRCPQKLATHFRAPLDIHPDAGHDLSLDAPQWMADRVQAWVESPGTPLRAHA